MRRAGMIGALVILVVLLFAVNMLAGVALQGARVDLTQGRVFTLTQGSRNIAAGFDEPVTLTLYYSEKLAQGQAQLQTYAKRVRELLEEYARISGGKIKVRVVDPEPSSEMEDEAVAAGIAGIPVSQTDAIYFGLVGTNSVDTREVIPFLDPSKERFLEYDISRVLYSLGNPEKKVVGLITSLPMAGGFTMNPQTQQPMQTPAWQIAQQVRSVFELRALHGTQTAIPDDIDVLMVAHPKNLDDATLFAIDQYVLKGGKLIAFVDPFCENDQQAAQDPTQRRSEFDKLLAAWGVELVKGRIAADRELAKPVMIGSPQRPERVSYVAWIGAKGERVSREDPATADLGEINFATAGFLRAKEAAKAEGAATAAVRATVTPLITTTPTAWQMPVEMVLFNPDPKAMLEQYQPGKESLTIAARLSGEVESAFPAGVPSADPAKPATPAGLTRSQDGINVVVVADADVLADALWVHVQNFLGQQMARKVAANADFVINALDNMSGSSDLISVRARQEEARPFDLVQGMQKRAQERYAAEQKALQMEIEDAQRRINELQAQRGEGEQSFVLTEAQQKEVDALTKKMLDSRKKLRAVRRNLDQDIEALGTKLKFINIGLVPALVTVGAVGLGGLRAARRRRGVNG